MAFILTIHGTQPTQCQQTVTDFRTRPDLNSRILTFALFCLFPLLDTAPAVQQENRTQQPEKASRWEALRQLSPSKSRIVERSSTCSKIVDTQYGQLKGWSTTVDLPEPYGTNIVDAYLGLQYASLLGGELRFMPPTGPMEKWEGTKVAQKFKPVCPQRVANLEELRGRVSLLEFERRKFLQAFVEKQQEDCLTMNIYVPRKKDDSDDDDDDDVYLDIPSAPLPDGKNKKREKKETKYRNRKPEKHVFPVLLFIHGESFDTGTGNAYEGEVMAAAGHVIVVTFNYRLGVFGFLSTENSHAPGNYAIMDVVAALHFIRENIGAFGGDPNQVTLMGHDHASVLINLLLISPVVKGKNLFRGVIMSGASLLSNWALVKNPLAQTIALAYRFNCSQSPLSRHLDVQETQELLFCLKHIPSEDLVKSQLPSTWFFSSIGPVVDHRTLLAKNLEIMNMSYQPQMHASSTSSSVSSNSFSTSQQSKPANLAEDVQHLRGFNASKRPNDFHSDAPSVAAASSSPVSDKTIHQRPSSTQSQIKSDGALTDRLALEPTALIFDNVPIMLALPATKPCGFGFPKNVYELFHALASDLSGGAFGDGKSSGSAGASEHLSVHQAIFLHKLKTNTTPQSFTSPSSSSLSLSLSELGSSDKIDDNVTLLNSRVVRFLRTFTQNLFTFHRQKIFDVLLYHYRDWETKRDRGAAASTPKARYDLDTFNVGELLVDGLYLAPLIKMLQARVSSADPLHSRVWVYALDELVVNSHGFVLLSHDYNFELPATKELSELSEICFSFQSLFRGCSSSEKRDSSNFDSYRWSGAKLSDDESRELMRAVKNLRAFYSFGFKVKEVASSSSSSAHAPISTGLPTAAGKRILPEANRLIMDKWINFIRTGNPNNAGIKKRKTTADDDGDGDESTSSHGTATGTDDDNDADDADDIDDRYEDLYWPEYDAEKQSYLSITHSDVEIKRHYRGSKMSLWLDLIPRIHRSDNLSEQHHLLDSFDDPGTFVAEGLNVGEYNRLVRLYSYRLLAKEVPVGSANKTGSTSAISSRASGSSPNQTSGSTGNAIKKVPTIPTSEPNPYDNSTFKKKDVHQLVRLENASVKKGIINETESPNTLSYDDKTASGRKTHLVDKLIHQPTNLNFAIETNKDKVKSLSSQMSFDNDDDDDEVISSLSSSPSSSSSTYVAIAQVPLGITVGVGCVLLLLNAIVFAAVFYQKSKARRTLEKRQREAGGCCQHGDNYARDADGDASPRDEEETGFYQSRGGQTSRESSLVSNCLHQQQHCDDENYSKIERSARSVGVDPVGFGYNCSDSLPPSTAASDLMKRSKTRPPPLAGDAHLSAVNGSESAASGTKQYPLPPPPRPPSHCSQHINSAFGKPQQQLLTKDVSHIRQSPKHSASSTRHQVSFALADANAKTSAAKPPSSLYLAGTSKPPVLAFVNDVDNRLAVVGETGPTTTAAAVWKTTAGGVNESCYEDALSRLETDSSFENDASTLV